MKKSVIVIVLLSMLLVSALFMNGCFISRITGNIVRGITESATGSQSSEGAETDIDEWDTSPDMSVKLPEGFPRSVPIYPDMSIDYSDKSTHGGRDFFYVGFTTRDSGEKVFNWYKKKMGDWEIQTEMINQSKHEKSHTIRSSNGEYGLTVSITEDQYTEGTMVILSVDEEMDFN